MRGLRTDARLAWQVLRGSPPSEWWRLALTALGAALGTGFALAAAVVAAIGTRDDGPPRYTNNLLNEAGLRPGVIAVLLLLLLPVFAFLGQCTRIGALRREHRLAALRLSGATPRQVRRIAALETGAAGGLGRWPGWWASWPCAECSRRCRTRAGRSPGPPTCPCRGFPPPSWSSQCRC
ncbi:hypothetical protein [Actinacidiphila sp. bgisy167]|uniref:hypothetical protein n=1 Tax=Actinacidiphila sp. bgisy167 TaxID=3413797 RepID=UPI003D73C28A